MKKYTGLRKIAGDSKRLSGFYSGEYIQINLDKSSNKVWGDYFYSLGQNSWNEYHDPDVVVIGNISTPHTMAEIEQLIDDRLNDLANELW